MSTKELAYSMLDGLTDEQLDAIIMLIRSFRNEPANEKTATAVREAHKGLNLVGPFDSVDSLWEDLNA